MTGRIAAVSFDVAGTLLHPVSPARVYAEMAHRYGAPQLDERLVGQRFRAAFARQDQLDREQGHATGPARELARWRAIVAEVLPEVPDLEGCFAALYAYYAQPQAWVPTPGAEPMLARLRQRGLRLGLATNFDARLMQVLAGHRWLERLDFIVTSEAVGWSKPARAFFARVVELAGCPAELTLQVGDDPVNDVQGAIAAGLQARLVGPSGATWADLAPWLDD
jgi:putative hydrolase of the HAD superfamily